MEDAEEGVEDMKELWDRLRAIFYSEEAASGRIPERCLSEHTQYHPVEDTYSIPFPGSNYNHGNKSAGATWF